MVPQVAGDIRFRIEPDHSAGATARVRSFSTPFTSTAIAAVATIAFLYGKGGFGLVLGITGVIALGFVVATAAIAVLVNGVEKERTRAVAPAE